MPERNVITEVANAGIETVYGTSVAATRQFAANSIELSPEFEGDDITTMGFKIPTGFAPAREWAAGDLGGYPTYNELVYVYNSLLKKVTGVTASGATTWTWDWSSISVETVDSYTLEQGDAATRAHEVSGAMFTGHNATFPRAGSSGHGGSLLARAFVDGITLTPALTALTPKPILGSQIDTFVDTTWAGLGTTKLLRVTEPGYSIAGMWGPFWVSNTANTSFQSVVQNRPTIEVSLQVEADSAGMAYLANMRAGSLIFVRIQATGPQIAAGPGTYRARWDFACIIGGTPAWGEVDSVRTVTWPLRVVHDGTSGKSLRFELVNELPTA